MADIKYREKHSKQEEETQMNKPRVHLHKDSRLHYLLGKENVIFETGIVLSRADFDATGSVPGSVMKLLSEAGPEKRGYDYVYACSTGNLRRKKGIADLEVNPRTKRRRERQTRQANEAAAGEQKKATIRQFVFSSAFLVMSVMAIVGVGSAIMSAYHTSTFLYEGGKPAWASLMTGTMLILFSGTAFTAARYFFQEKGALCIFGLLFIVAGLAVIVYSMFSTLTVNYNQFQWRDDEKTAVAVAGDEALAVHNRLLDGNRAALEEVNAEIARLETETGYWRALSWDRYDKFNTALIAASERREGLRAERIRLESETPEVAERAAASQDTIYTFLSRLLGLQEDVARFFVYIVPACLYDILAPFALSVVLLLADKRRKQNG
jgi:hypothetical protein